MKTGCSYFVKDSRPNRLHIACPSTKIAFTDEKCPFNLIANYRLDGMVYIISVHLNHSDSCTLSRNASAQAMYTTVVPILTCVETVRPKDVMSLVRQEHGTNSTYPTAWRCLQNFQS